MNSYQSFKEYIPRIAGKLACDGMAVSNYTERKAMDILSRTVAPVFCQKVLRLYQTEVVALLPAEPLSND